ncbi:MAG: helix-turn-helix domain-containing protein [Myxococcota bacterium]
MSTSGYQAAVAAKRRGVAADTIAAKLGLRIVADFGQTLRADRTGQFFEALADASDTPSFAWEAGCSERMDTWSPLMIACRGCPSGADALRIFLDYWPCVTNAYEWIGEERSGEAPVVLVLRSGPLRSWMRPLVEFDLGEFITVARALTRPDLPLRVELADPISLARVPATLRRSVSVVPSDRTALQIDPELLVTQVSPSQPLASRLAVQELDRLRSARQAGVLFQHRVGQVLRLHLPHVRTAADVAQQLSLTTRTLERKLQEEGTTFREVRSHVQESLARELIAERPLKELAYLLGFGDARAFARAFRRWTGVSPSEFRGKS